MTTILVRKALGFLSGSAEPAVGDMSGGEVVTDALRALWTRDYQAQPAQSLTPISTSIDVTAVPSFRRLRFDGAGTVKIDAIKGDGTTAAGVTFTVSAGEVWNVASVAIAKIYSTANGTSATGIVGLG